MTTYGELKNRLLRLVKDPAGAQHDDDMMLDAIVAAHDAILPWYPKRASTTLAGDAATTVFDLPTDLYRLEAVINGSTGSAMQPASLAPRVVRGEHAAANDWLEYPQGQVTFSLPLDSGSHTVLYLAEWAKPTDPADDSFVLTPPGFLALPMAYYAAAYLLNIDGVGSANIRQYGTRIDSGTPEDNPKADMAEVFLKLFLAEMARIPAIAKAPRI